MYCVGFFFQSVYRQNIVYYSPYSQWLEISAAIQFKFINEWSYLDNYWVGVFNLHYYENAAFEIISNMFLFFTTIKIMSLELGEIK